MSANGGTPKAPVRSWKKGLLLSAGGVGACWVMLSYMVYQTAGALSSMVGVVARMKRSEMRDGRSTRHNPRISLRCRPGYAFSHVHKQSSAARLFNGAGSAGGA